jgi:hypothetical protein
MCCIWFVHFVAHVFARLRGQFATHMYRFTCVSHVFAWFVHYLFISCFQRSHHNAHYNTRTTSATHTSTIGTTHTSASAGVGTIEHQ